MKLSIDLSDYPGFQQPNYTHRSNQAETLVIFYDKADVLAHDL